MALNDAQRWMRINQELGIALPGGPYAQSWKNFVIALYEQIEDWMDHRRQDHRHTAWDFCVIHSCSRRDRSAAEEFKRLLETTLGITGKTLGDVELGENTLAAAETMVTGSTKVFVLASKFLDLPAVPKFVFQSALMEQLHRPDWKRKLVPMYLPGTRERPPFFLANIQGFTLGNDPQTVELVNKAIPIDDQIRVRRKRQRAEANLLTQLRREKEERLQHIREVVAELRDEFGDDYDPTDSLDQISEHLRSFKGQSYEDSGAGQVINISGSSSISVGPSFHISVHRDATASPLSESPFTEEDYTTASSSY